MSPVLTHAPELLLKAQGVALAFFDVDGVLTDGGLYFSATGETLKRFHVLDGHGMQLLQAGAITPVVISGRDGKPLRNRLRALGVECHLGIGDKHAMAQECLRSHQLAWEQAAVIGDDWPDLALIQRCAFSAAPPGAHAEVLAAVDHVTQRPAGAGAAREFCDLLLVAAGRYAELLAKACT